MRPQADSAPELVAAARAQEAAQPQRVVVAELPIFGNFLANFRSFSAVSAPIFARKYAFCSIFQNLPDYQAEIFESWQNLNFADFAKFANFVLKFQKKMLIFQTDFLRKF